MDYKQVIWYISKYPAPYSRAQSSWRAFAILEELKKAGHTPVMITSASKHGASYRDLHAPVHKEVERGIDVYWLKGMRYSRSTSIRRVLSWFEFEIRLFLMPKNSLPKPDTVIVSSLSPLTILNGLFLRYKYKATLISEIRDIWPLTLISSGKIHPRHPFAIFLNFIERISYRYANAVVGTMPNLVEHIAKTVKYHAPVFCIPQGLSLEQQSQNHPLEPSFINNYIPKNKFIVCHAGSIGISNALDPLIEAAKILEKSNPHIHFLLVGDGGLKEEFESQTQNLKNITFAPRIKKDQVQSLLKHVDVTYFSTNGSEIWNYGQSLNKIIDYMFAAKPIIASYSGYPSMINEAKCGEFVPVNDAQALSNTILKYASKSQIDLIEIGERGKKWLHENREFSKLADNYIRLINSVR